MKAYIYLIRNKINGKIYIGQKRNRDKEPLRDNYWGCGVLIVKAIKKYGIENFEKEILHENIETQKELNDLEIQEIINHDSLAKNKKGYNLASGGIQCGNPFAGFSEERKKEFFERVAVSNRGRKNSIETIVKMKLAHTFIPPKEYDKIENAYRKKCKEKVEQEYKFSEEHRKKIADSKRGKKLNLSEEQHKSYSERCKGSGNSRWIEVEESVIDQIEKWYMEDKCSMKFIFEKTGLKTGKVKRLLEKRGIITGDIHIRRYTNES